MLAPRYVSCWLPGWAVTQPVGVQEESWPHGCFVQFAVRRALSAHRLCNQVRRLAMTALHHFGVRGRREYGAHRDEGRRGEG
jgi:hypothetical protein